MISFLKLIRWPNILIIWISMFLMLFCVINPVLGLRIFEAGLNLINFLLLIMATSLIAMAGYLQNDLLDINPDSVNRPGKNMVGRRFRVHVVQILYWIFTVSGVLLGVYVSFAIGKINYGLVFVFAAGLLWFYSERYQCQPVIGNIVIAFLSALTIAIVWLFSFFALIQDPVVFTSVQQKFSNLNILILLFSGFAFFTSLMREMIKDIQDFKGDDRFGCRTLPIVIGVKKTKWIALAVTLLTFSLSIWCQVFFIGADFEKLFYYFFVVDLLFLIVALMLTKARKPEDYKKVSAVVKLLMIIGILSMSLVYFEY
ncbi:MAG: geranylgeranylglycerol-phosphate geranylgeranyltransferase [Bacteroidales bacterium]|nr:geranylgeranylglycerol-phosphate geranylgeranyltransferase [Bacteroidales bacterium]